MQLAESARYTPYILIYGKIYAEHLDITDRWKDLARILTVGSRISHMRPAESVRYTAYIVVCGKTHAVYLGITDS